MSQKDRLQEAKEYAERERKNRQGLIAGYGYCFICHDSYSWKKEHHDIPHEFNKDGRMSASMFPYCSECQENATDEEKKVAIRKLVNIWIAEFPDKLEKFLKDESIAIEHMND